MQGKSLNRDGQGSTQGRVCPTCGRGWREIGVGEGDHPDWDVDNVSEDVVRKREEDAAWDDFLYNTDK
jgi:hypothetical protein